MMKHTEMTPLLSNPNGSHWWSRLARRYRTTAMCVTSKAAMLTLFWSFFIGILYGLSSNLGRVFFPILKLEFISLIYILNAISLCFYPLSGYLADNVNGKYKMITRSLQVLIIAVIAAILLAIVSLAIFFIAQLTNDGDWIGTYAIIGISTLSVLFYIAMNVSFVGFNANVIQFGMEQLHDSPTDHQSLYIYWYVWIYYLVQILILQPWSFLSFGIMNFKFITSMVLFGLLGGMSFLMVAVSLCVAHRNKNWFLIIPARVNPYKLVRRITRFARQHKVPIRRSAFTYCEDEIPTGLDLAKTKYGGPFSTEEVEDVKALYGIIKILLSLGPVFFFTYASDPAFYWYTSNVNFERNDSNRYFDDDAQKWFAYQYLIGSNMISSLVIIVLIPMYILIVTPLRCCNHVNMLKRIGLGIVFQILTLISIAVLVSSVRPVKNSCIFFNWFEDYDYNDIKMPYIYGVQVLLPIIPQMLYGIANMLLYTALYEFICAQSPPSMKGLLIGLSFAIRGIFEAIGAAFVIPFSFIPKTFPSCGMWYYGTNVLLAIVALIIFIYMARKYKYRLRDEICDVYRYAEEYYSNVQEEQNYD